MLLLGTGHCFRDHVLEVCPEFARFSSDAEGIRKSFEGSSLETIKHMVASGMGITVVPQLSVPREPQPHQVRYIPFDRRRCPRAGWCWPGAAASRATRPSRRCAMRSMPAP
jgi:DNA-binding transcriptional LysR family regulator